MVTKTALITGVTHGIGYYMALAMAKKNIRVIGLGRTQSALEQLDHDIRQCKAPNPTMIAVDLASDDFEQKAYVIAQTLYDRDKKCDYFIGNAGILGALTPLTMLSPNEFAKILKVNVQANHILLHALYPLLQQSQQARVALVSSGASKSLPSFWGGYSISKVAIDAMAQTLEKEWQKNSCSITIMNPGATRTNMRAEAFPGENPDRLPHPRDVADKLIHDFCDTASLPNYIAY